MKYLDELQGRDEDLAAPKLQLQPAKKAGDRVHTHRPLSLKLREEISKQSDRRTYHEVTPETFGQRVDEFVLAKCPHWSYQDITKLVEQGHVYRYRKNGKRRYARLTDRLELNELVAVPNADLWQQIAPPSGLSDQPKATKKAVPLSPQLKRQALEWVLFKNEHVVVINKPCGIPMMPGTNQGINIADMLAAWQFTNGTPPLVCHNLDRETSGVVVLARNKNAHRMLGRMFMKRVVPNSVYWGFLSGTPTALFGRIRMHFEVNKTRGGNQIVARPTPTATTKVAIAEYVVNANVAEYGSFVSFYPLTSRSHQTRIMAAHALRCPVIGDAKFGGNDAYPQALSAFWDPEDKGLPLHLHHRKVQLPYKNSRGEFECVTAPLPPIMRSTFQKLGWPTDADDPLIPG
jgi:23S rRNA-/tRNA-specific pseudouridylate synthase